MRRYLITATSCICNGALAGFILGGDIGALGGGLLGLAVALCLPVR